MAPVGLDILAERRDLVRRAVDHEGDGAVLDSRRHRLEAGRPGARDDGLGPKRGGEIDVAGGAPEQRVAHAAADEAGFLAGCVQSPETGLHARAGQQPGRAIGVEAGRERAHRKWPGTKRPFS